MSAGIATASTILLPASVKASPSLESAVTASISNGHSDATGRSATHDYLRGLGASAIIDRALLTKAPERPLDSERWAGAIDAVGSTTLATILTQLKYRGSVAACGLAGGSDLPTTVMPFLLRGVNLLGIDSVMCPLPERLVAWERLVRDLPMEKLDAMTETVPLAALPDLADAILKGETRGRVVVDVNSG